MRSNFLFQFIVSGLLLCCLLGCREKGVAEKEDFVAAPTVKIFPISSELYKEKIELPGRVVAERVADIRARVAGIVIKKYFMEGEVVQVGDPLFMIEDAPYRAKHAKAVAEVERAKANLFQKKAEYNRAEPLYTIKAISPQEYDTKIANVKVAEAALLAAKAELQSAEINLGYTKIVAPISGRIDLTKVTEGTMVGQEGATLMATIRQMDPVYVDFTQPVSQYLQLKKSIQEQITLFVDNSLPLKEGRFLFSEAKVEKQTGQLHLRGEFANSDGTLLPGMFVRVQIYSGKEKETIFIPQQSISWDSQGKSSVFIIDNNNIARQRAVQVGKMVDGKWQILAGVSAGENIIASNVDQVRSGLKIEKGLFASLGITREKQEQFVKM